MPSSFWLLPILGLASCSAPGPVPTDQASRRVAEVVLDESARAQVDLDTAAALLALRSGDDAQARKLAKNALSRDPRAARARAILGRLLLTQTLRTSPPEIAAMEKVEGELLLARRLDSDDPEVMLFHSQFLEADGHISLAVEVLDGLVAGDPEHLEGLRGASRLHFELGEERAATPLLERVLALDPQDEESLYRLAHCRLDLAEAVDRGDLEASEQSARELFRRAAGDFGSYQALASDEILGYLGQARALLRAAELLEPDQPQQALGEFDAVIELLVQAETQEPNSPEPRHARGAVLVRLGRLAEARTLFESALRLDPVHLPTLLDLARVLDTLGEKELAQDLCRRALALPVTPTERRQLERYLSDGRGAGTQVPMME